MQIPSPEVLDQRRQAIGAEDVLPEVAIFRHNLFRISEPFIAEQAQHLRRYRPLYVGRKRFGLPPDGASSLALEDLYKRWKLPRIGWQMLTGDAQPYLRLLGRGRPSLIHAHFGIEGVSALGLAMQLEIPLVTTFHGFDATLKTHAMLGSPAWFRYPLLRRRLAREGNLFLCASSFIRQKLLETGFPESRTHTHYIGVDCQTIRPRADFEETPLILHVARLVEVKGTRYLLRAFATVARKYDRVQLLIIGDGPLRRQLHALTASLGMRDRVKFLGAVPHVAVLSWMRSAAMLVLPGIRTATGREEGLGMVLLEAAATGLPIVGSRVGGIPECMLEGKTGFLVPERDEDALARRMAELLEDPVRRHRMGAAGRALVEDRFDIDRQTAVLESFYDSLLGRLS
ncbi:MAG TPA: glycosyltransferase [Steroidobacteraceae bacterium]|nr:glycosyltransferase [Steroidobacteraceae bacterium]